jgi:hypothetical protein
MSTATLTLGLPATAAAIAVRRRLLGWLRTPGGIITVASAVILIVGLVSSFPGAGEYRGPILSAPATYRADI